MQQQLKAQKSQHQQTADVSYALAGSQQLVLT